MHSAHGLRTVDLDTPRAGARPACRNDERRAQRESLGSPTPTGVRRTHNERSQEPKGRPVPANRQQAGESPARSACHMPRTRQLAGATKVSAEVLAPGRGLQPHFKPTSSAPPHARREDEGTAHMRARPPAPSGSAPSHGRGYHTAHHMRACASNALVSMTLPSSYACMRYANDARAKAWLRFGSRSTFRRAFDAAVMAWM